MSWIITDRFPLLSTVSKIVEKTVFEQVYEYFHNYKLFYDNQYGFRKSHSTVLTAMELIDRITRYLDSGKLPVSVFLFIQSFRHSKSC